MSCLNHVAFVEKRPFFFSTSTDSHSENVFASRFYLERLVFIKENNRELKNAGCNVMRVGSFCCGRFVSFSEQKIRFFFTCHTSNLTILGPCLLNVYYYLLTYAELFDINEETKSKLARSVKQEK